MASGDLRRRLQKLLRERRLPREEGVSLTERRGVAAYCCVCNLAIDPAEIAVEVKFFEDPEVLTEYTFHAACYTLWNTERNTMLQEGA